MNGERGPGMEAALEHEAQKEAEQTDVIKLPEDPQRIDSLREKVREYRAARLALAPDPFLEEAKEPEVKTDKTPKPEEDSGGAAGPEESDAETPEPTPPKKPKSDKSKGKRDAGNAQGGKEKKDDEERS